MAIGNDGHAPKGITLTFFVLLAGVIAVCPGCASLHALYSPVVVVKLGEEVACDNRKPAGEGAISEELCEEVNALIRKEGGIDGAKVGFDVQGKGRLQLAGRYKNEDEVERAFIIAQSVVGSQGVSPVTPGQIEVEEWQECLRNTFAGRRCKPVPEPYRLDKKPPGPIRDRYALIVGVGQFKNDDSGQWQLRYAVEDAEAVYHYLSDPQLGNFPFSHITKLTDQQATRQAILNALADLEQRAQQDDLVVVYFSTHGTQPDMFDYVHIATYDIDLLFRNKKELSPREVVLRQQALWDSSIPRQRLHDFFRKVQSKRVLMILDVCYSGDVFTPIPGFRPTGSEILAQREEHYATGLSAEQLVDILGAKDLMVVEDNTDRTSSHSTPTFQPLDSITVNIPKVSSDPAKSWGRVILSASDKDERSWEPDLSSSTPNSYFTYYLLENLRQTDGQIQKSFLSAVPLVGRAAQEISMRRGERVTQQPQSFSIPYPDKWNFSLNERR
jgi:hypothetical protein